MSEENEHKGKIPKKPENEKLSETISAAVTEKMKADVKHEAEVEDESVSQLVRNSIKDIVYHDLHPEKTIKELVEEGHEEHSIIRKTEGKKVEEIKADDKANAISVAKMKEILNIFKFINLEHVNHPIQKGVKIEFENQEMVLTISNGNDIIRTKIPFINDLPSTFPKSIVIDFEVLLKLFSNSTAKIAKIRVEDSSPNYIFIDFDNKQNVKIFAQKGTEYPNIEISTSQTISSISTEDFIKLVESVEYLQPTVSQADWEFQGIQFRIFNDHIALEASDGYRYGYIMYVLKSDISTYFILNKDSVYTALKVLPLTHSKQINLSLITYSNYDHYRSFLPPKALQIHTEDIDMFFKAEEDYHYPVAHTPDSIEQRFTLGKQYAAFEVEDAHALSVELEGFFDYYPSSVKDPYISLFVRRQNNKDEFIARTVDLPKPIGTFLYSVKVLENKFESNVVEFMVNLQYFLEAMKLFSLAKFGRFIPVPEGTKLDGKVILALVSKSEGSVKYMVLRPKGYDNYMVVINAKPIDE